MTETERITKLFRDLYDGKPWLDITILDSLKNIPAEKAAAKTATGRNSIWEIVNHMISWRINVLNRLKGLNTATSPGNYFFSITDTSDNAWKETLKQLDETQRQWLEWLANADEQRLEEIYAGNNMTFYEHIHGIMQHDAYHLGQVVLMSKL